MKIKEYILSLFGKITIFKWKVVESFIAMDDEKSEEDVSQTYEEQFLNYLQQVNPMMYDEIMSNKFIKDIQSGKINGVGQ